MTSRTIALPLILSLLLTAQPVESSDATPATAVVESLTNLAEFRQAITDMPASNVPPGTAAELARGMLGQDQEFWETLKNELAPALEKQMAQDELTDLSARLGSEPNQAWDSSQESIIGTFRELATTETAVGAYLRRFGCQIGFLAAPIDAAMQQARAAGKTVSVNSDLIGKMSFMMAPTAETCDCLFEKLAKGHGKEYVVNPALHDEAGKITRELLISGQCPDPFAQFNAKNQ